MKVLVAKALEGFKELVNQFFDDYEVYVSEEIQMESDPTSFEEAMRSVYSFEWQEAMEVEMNSMNTNDVWDLKENSQWSQNSRLWKGLQDKIWLQMEYGKI